VTAAELHRLAINAKSGDERCWTKLLAELLPQIFSQYRSLATFLPPGYESEDMQSLITGYIRQVLAAWQPEKAAINTFVLHAVKRKLINIHRSAAIEKRTTEKSLCFVGDDTYHVLDSAELDSKYESAEMLAAFKQLMSTVVLSKPQKRTVDEIIANPELSMAEIARQIGVRQNVVQRHIAEIGALAVALADNA
jgi:DNA-directed RNA polymerase specialized sigma24 family protein